MTTLEAIFYHCRCTECVYNPQLKHWFSGFRLNTCQKHIQSKGRAFPDEGGEPRDLVSAGRRPYPDGLPHYPGGVQPIPPTGIVDIDDMEVDAMFQPFEVLQAHAFPPLQAASAAGPPAAAADPAAAAAGPAAAAPAHAGHGVDPTGASAAQNAVRAARIAQLELLQPGKDGSTPKVRFNKTDFNEEGLEDATDADRDRIFRVCMRIFKCKTDSVSYSEADFARAIEAQRQTFLESPHASEQALAALLPATFKGCLTFLRYMEMKLEGVPHQDGLFQYEACSQCFDLYRGETKGDKFCSCCALLGNRVERATNKIMFTYHSLEAMIIAMFLVPVLAEGLGSWPERLSTDGTISDTCDADVCSKMWAEMGPEARNLVIMLYFDPFMLYKDNSKYSCAPLVAIFQNFPAHIRWKHVAAHLLGIEPGTKNRNVVPNRRSMFQLVSDEIAYLSMVGVMVHDKHKGDNFRCFVRLAAVLSDYRGLQELTEMLGSPTEHPCWKCWVKGHLVGPGKRVLTNSYVFLPLNHPLRRNPRLVALNNTSGKVLTGREVPPRKRTTIELFQNNPLPDSQATLLPGEKSAYYDVGQEIPDELQHVGPMPALSADSCPMWSAKPTPVPGPIWDMVQYDAMHTFAGDSKAYMFNILGIAPHKKAMVIPYDAAVNKRHGAPWIAPEAGLARMREGLALMAKQLSNGSRVRLFLDKNSATKMSIYIKMCGHLGAYMIACAASGPNAMPSEQADAICNLLHAIGEMWCKNPNRADLSKMELRTIVAMCLQELHLSTQLCDVKQHNLRHMVEGILALGPLHMWSMFPAEGLWHWLMCNARNKNSAEATMLFAFIDKQRVDRWALTSLRTEADRYYYVGEYIAHSHKISIQVQGKMSRGDFSFLERGALIMFYVKSLPILDGLWGAAVRLFGTTHTAQQLSDVGLSRTGVTGFDFQSKPRRPWQLSVSLFWDTFSDDVEAAVGRPLTASEQRTVRLGPHMISPLALRATAVQLGPLHLRKSRSTADKSYWMLHRKGTDASLQEPRFGIFEEAFTHPGLDGRDRIIIKGKWFRKAGLVYHPIIRAPMASVREDETFPTFCLASDIVPMQCFAMADPGNAGRYIMCTDDSWHVLPLLGFKAIP